MRYHPLIDLFCDCLLVNALAPFGYCAMHDALQQEEHLVNMLIWCNPTFVDATIEAAIEMLARVVKRGDKTRALLLVPQ